MTKILCGHGHGHGHCPGHGRGHSHGHGYGQGLGHAHGHAHGHVHGHSQPGRYSGLFHCLGRECSRSRCHFYIVVIVAVIVMITDIFIRDIPRYSQTPLQKVLTYFKKFINRFCFLCLLLISITLFPFLHFQNCSTVLISKRNSPMEVCFVLTVCVLVGGR